MSIERKRWSKNKKKKNAKGKVNRIMDTVKTSMNKDPNLKPDKRSKKKKKVQRDIFADLPPLIKRSSLKKKKQKKKNKNKSQIRKETKLEKSDLLKFLKGNQDKAYLPKEITYYLKAIGYIGTKERKLSMRMYDFLVELMEEGVVKRIENPNKKRNKYTYQFTTEKGGSIQKNPKKRKRNEKNKSNKRHKKNK